MTTSWLWILGLLAAAAVGQSVPSSLPISSSISSSSSSPSPSSSPSAGLLQARSRILMVTMGGTRSHKVPFLALGHELVARGHNITFLNAFPPARDAKETPGFQEVTPLSLVLYVRNYTDWDLVGARFRGDDPVPLDQALAYAYQTCEVMLSDPEMQHFLHDGRQYDLLILDGAFPECALGLVHHFQAPFMYINTVGFHTGPIFDAGSPTPWATEPFFMMPYTNRMGLLQRTYNSVLHASIWFLNKWIMSPLVQAVLNKHFLDMPPIQSMTRNVSVILQNSHHTVSYPRPYLPNVVEVACIHCREPRPLAKHLDEFVRGGAGNGFIFVSMGSSVRATNMPELLRLLFLRVFAQLPYQVLWKWEFGSESMPDLPPNVRLERWLPQQDLLGHPKIVAFLTHGGLLSMFETVYHGVPVVTLPVFCDHDANSAKAQDDGYAIMLELHQLTAEQLLESLLAVIEDPKYRAAALFRQTILRDQRTTPLETAVYWTEYVLRYRGATHLQAPVKDMPIYQYLLLDVLALLLLAAYASWKLLGLAARALYRALVASPDRRKANGVVANGKKHD